MVINNIPWTKTKRTGPPSPTEDFDAASADYAQTVDVDAEPTRLASRAAPAIPSVKTGDLGFISLRSLGDTAVWLLWWGFLRLLRYQISPELIRLVDLAVSPVSVAVAAVVATAILSLIQAKGLAVLKALQGDLTDAVMPEPDSVLSLRQRLTAINHGRDVVAIALVSYILVRAI